MEYTFRVYFIQKIQQDATIYQNFVIPYLYEAVGGRCRVET